MIICQARNALIRRLRIKMVVSARRKGLAVLTQVVANLLKEITDINWLWLNL
jgi:hypothetical protein